MILFHIYVVQQIPSMIGGEVGQGHGFFLLVSVDDFVSSFAELIFFVSLYFLWYH